MSDHSTPAFPRPQSRGSSGTVTAEAQSGMSLRDWFAGQALAGVMSGRATINADGWVPQAAYRLADAMLAARDAEQEDCS